MRINVTSRDLSSLLAHNPGFWLAAGGGTWALIGPARPGGRGPQAPGRAECDHGGVSVLAPPDRGSVSRKYWSTALNIFMWERDPATWSEERVSEICGARKVFQCFQVWGRVWCLEWYWAGSLSAIIIRCLGQTSRTWSSKPKVCSQTATKHALKGKSGNLIQV